MIIVGQNVAKSDLELTFHRSSFGTTIFVRVLPESQLVADCGRRRRQFELVYFFGYMATNSPVIEVVVQTDLERCLLGRQLVPERNQNLVEFLRGNVAYQFWRGENGETSQTQPCSQT